ncbi:MAG: glycosyltransferase family 39 protein, partial [Lentisphaeria bacterium]|nr:glycosyltransferase family 39 protein [Lentisphaeria bacterium]
MSAEKFLYRHWGKILFSVNLFLGIFIFLQGRKLGLFAPPRPGMDQHTILEAAQNIANGIFPVPGKYLYSPTYTLFLGLSAKIGGGNLFVMRLVQLAVVSLVPWMIYRTSIFAGFGRKAAAVAGVLWLFCGSAMLISLDFLRAAPLALCFVLLVYFLLRSRRSSRLHYTVFAGVFAGLCMLGRENFIPVVCLPVLFMIFPLKKKQ